jgi:hypothetical protein
LPSNHPRCDQVVPFQCFTLSSCSSLSICVRLEPATCRQVCLELYKQINGAELEAYRNTFANLALPLFAMAEPIAPKAFKYNGLEWTLWDRWVLEGDMTVQQCLDWMEERKLTAYSISCGQVRYTHEEPLVVG